MRVETWHDAWERIGPQHADDDPSWETVDAFEAGFGEGLATLREAIREVDAWIGYVGHIEDSHDGDQAKAALKRLRELAQEPTT